MLILSVFHTVTSQFREFTEPIKHENVQLQPTIENEIMCLTAVKTQFLYY